MEYNFLIFLRASHRNIKDSRFLSPGVIRHWNKQEWAYTVQSIGALQGCYYTMQHTTATSDNPCMLAPDDPLLSIVLL